jgi:hypothetical protein
VGDEMEGNGEFMNPQMEPTKDNHGIKRTFIKAVFMVFLATLTLPHISGYGTILYQFLIFRSWGMVKSYTSASFADQHSLIVWLLVGSLTLALFLIPAGIIVLFSRRFFSAYDRAFLMVWTFFFIACLFFLFPATDGP